MPFLAADFGTTTLKVALVDESGNFLDFLRSEVPILRVEPKAAEHSPEGLVNLFLELSKKLLKHTNAEIEGIVFSGYLFGLVGIDDTGTPLTGVMTWLDRRPTETLQEMYSKVQPSWLYRRTGCPSIYVYQLPKIYWLRKKKPEIYDKVEYFLDVKGYVIYRLTGRIVFEKSAASGSQLLNLETLTWDEEVVRELDLDSSKLPELVEPDEIIGELDRKIASQLGLKNPVPVIPGVFDGGSVSIGEGALGENIGSSHLSTSTMIRVASETPILDKSGKMRFQTYYAFRGTWLPGGALNNAGVVLKWFRDNLAMLEKLAAEEIGVDPYDALTREAMMAPAGSDGLIFLPFISGERIPEYGNKASGVLFGLRENHTRNHIIRSFMEGVAFNLKTVKDALEENSLEIKELRITGGGAKSDLWLQIISDVLEIPVKKVEAIDAALWGATIIGMKATNIINDVRKTSLEKARIAKVFTPIEENVRIYRESYRLFKELLEHIKPVFSKLENKNNIII